MIEADEPERNPEPASNLVLLVPEAQAIVDLCGAAMSPGKRLNAPAHITLVYPFIPPRSLDDKALGELEEFCARRPPLRFSLDVGWFGREVLLLRPSPEVGVVELTEAVIGNWPDFPYYGGVYDTIEPHLSLAFGDADSLTPLAKTVADLMPLTVEINEVSLLVGPHEAMTVSHRFPFHE